MSYFIFGSIQCATEGDFDELSWSILLKGIEYELYILFQHNIHQKDVLDMIGEQFTKTNHDLCFLITSSPISDTTDALISPSYFGEDDLKKVHDNLVNIGSFVNEVVSDGHVSGVILCFTEGYDNSFAAFRIKASQFYDIMAKEVNKMGDIPSVKFEITP